MASEGTPEEALAAFYAYESQVPRVAKEKERGLREMYGADDKTCGYFTLHTTADVYHSQVWRKQLEKRIEANPETADAGSGCRRERRAHAVAGAGWDRGAADGDGGGVSSRSAWSSSEPMIR